MTTKVAPPGWKPDPDWKPTEEWLARKPERPIAEPRRYDEPDGDAGEKEDEE